ncbi:EthD domain-containing protein [Chitinophaga varians]|uniref:EthD domain-containing protein n=1 Tax=Chitinophaga varians TaxID=2202339 RepID=UPI00165FC32B|nr:EthD domain-containing protein [Chitinophaga varians]MBC9909966.1 EthD domain-containing protein [Chitinophaga varians]
MQNNIASLTDNHITTLSITPVIKRKGLDRQRFHDYWKDIHGPVCARLPHLGVYIQHHMQKANPDLFPAIDGISREVAAENNWDGYAEIGFFSNADLEQWLPTTSILFDDEKNVFDTTVAYYCDNSSRTLKDRRQRLLTNGSDGRTFLYYFISLNPMVTQEDADIFFQQEFLPLFVHHDDISRVRYHILAPHDNSVPNPPAPDVEHYLAPEKQHRYVLEIATDSLETIKRMYQTTAFAALQRRMGACFSAVHVFESAGRYTMAYDGQITNAGLRGATNAALIAAVGAINQTGETVRNFLLTGK